MPTRRIALLLAVGLAVTLSPALVLNALAQAVTAAEPTNNSAVVTVPYGSWVGSNVAALQEFIISAILVLVAVVCRRVPATVGAVIKAVLTKEVVTRAVQFGVNTVADAVAGKALSFSAGNAVLANALNYIVQNAPTWLVKWLGGEKAIRDHIIAALPLEEGVSLSSATPTVPTDPEEGARRGAGRPSGDPTGGSYRGTASADRQE